MKKGQKPPESNNDAADKDNNDLMGGLTVGDILRKRRLETKMSIADVAHHTKIRSYYIEILEKGYHDELPELVYSSGFVKLYAKFLDLDEEKISAIFKSEFSKTAKIQHQNQYHIPTAKAGASKLSIAGLCIALVVIIYSAWYIYNEYYIIPNDIIVSDPSLPTEKETNNNDASNEATLDTQTPPETDGDDAPIIDIETKEVPESAAEEKIKTNETSTITAGENEAEAEAGAEPNEPKENITVDLAVNEENEPDNTANNAVNDTDNSPAPVEQPTYEEMKPSGDNDNNNDDDGNNGDSRDAGNPLAEEELANEAANEAVDETGQTNQTANNATPSNQADKFIKLMVSDHTWLRIVNEDDNKVLFSGVLAPDKSLIIPSPHRHILSTGVAKNLQFLKDNKIYDGADIFGNIFENIPMDDIFINQLKEKQS